MSKQLDSKNAENSNELYTLLPAFYASLQEYITEENDTYIKMKLPRNLIEINRELILANFKDCILTMVSDNPYLKVKLLKK